MLSCKNLSHTYARRPVVDNLSFELSSGQLLMLLGQNGAGKSTCLNVLVGLTELQQGRIDFGVGRNKVSWPDHRRFIGYLGAEHNGSFTHLSALENLTFWQSLNLSAPDKNDAKKLLDHWGLGCSLVMDRLAVNRFSTGMKRRLAFAKLEASKKPLWVLDEPLSGLDQSAVEIFIDALKRHLKNGGMAVVVSHELSPFEKIDRKIIRL